MIYIWLGWSLDRGRRRLRGYGSAVLTMSGFESTIGDHRNGFLRGVVLDHKKNTVLGRPRREGALLSDLKMMVVAPYEGSNCERRRGSFFVWIS
ncbi:hypothetical protein M6B38_340900 [Iris pallida]|uniref:Uncharacterized protein n=1 Tax=Iris pallida TaxID=29817 RepID=A0AAX6GX90_IRIPA|nr:hypothetical protein M6B38_340900 [Iris pallida]